MEYIKIVDDKVFGHFSSKIMPEGKEYKKVTNFRGWVGCDVGMLNEDGSLRPQSELITDGYIKDNRGYYWSIEDKRKISIKNLNVEIPEGFTKLEPKQFDDWDGSKWVESVDKKKKHEDFIKVSEARKYLFQTDYRELKSFREQKPLDELYPGETAIREEKRQIIRDLS